MGTIKKWAEINATHLGLCMLQAFRNLERGETGEVDLELIGTTPGELENLYVLPRDPHGPPAGRWLRIAPDLVNHRVVIFEIQPGQEATLSSEGGLKIGGNDADRAK